MKKINAFHIKIARKKLIGREEEMVNIRREIQSAERTARRRTFNRMAIKVSSKSDYMRPRQSMTVSCITCKEKKKQQPKGGVFTCGAWSAAIYCRRTTNSGFCVNDKHTHKRTHGGSSCRGFKASRPALIKADGAEEHHVGPRVFVPIRCDKSTFISRQTVIALIARGDDETKRVPTPPTQSTPSFFLLFFLKEHRSTNPQRNKRSAVTFFE